MTEREIFAEALLRTDPTERAAFLDGIGGRDSVSRRRIEELLALHERDLLLLDRLPLERLSGSEDNEAAVEATSAEAAARQLASFLSPSERPGALGRLSHYDVLEVLGFGGFGIVVRAFDDALQRVVAIKFLAPHLAMTSPPRKRFLREARAAAQIRHENVVQIYAVEEQPIPYLVMEFVEGVTLQHKLDSNGPLATAEVLLWGKHIALGLAAAHARGLIHRDVKPANILIETGVEVRAKLTDFGLARASDDASLTQSGVLAGTPMYMAPEQAKGSVLDPRADLFSLGSVLYTMAAGRPPFRAPTTLAVLRRVVEDTPRPIKEIIPETPQWLCDIIARLHAKNPDDRFQSARELADLLADCEAKLNAKQTVRLEMPRSSTGRHRQSRWKWMASTAGLCLLLALLTLLAVTEFTGVTHLFRAAPPRPQSEPSANVLSPSIATTNESATSASTPAAPIGPVLMRTLIGHPGMISTVKYSPDGKRLVSAGGSSVRVWDAESGDLLHSLKVAPSEEYYAVSFSPDSQWLLTSPMSANSNGDISIWNVSTGEFDAVFQGHTKGLFDISLSPDGKTLTSGGWDCAIRVWDFAERRQVRMIPLPGSQLIRSVVTSSDGVIAAGTESQIQFFEKEDDRPISATAVPVAPFGFLPGGKLLAGVTWKAGTASVWNPSTAERLASWPAHDGHANGIACSPDGKLLATAGDDGRVRLWDVNSHSQLAEVSHVGAAYGVTFSNDGKTLATTGIDDHLVKLWDITSVHAEDQDSHSLDQNLVDRSNTNPAVHDAWLKANSPLPVAEFATALTAKLKERIADFDDAFRRSMPAMSTEQQLVMANAWVRERQPAFAGFEDTWKKTIPQLSAETQLILVLVWLRECNPAFDNVYRHNISDGHLTNLEVPSPLLQDLSPLQTLTSLTSFVGRTTLGYDNQRERDVLVLRSLTSLETINGKPVDQFWIEADGRQAEFDQWLQRVPTLAEQEQVAEVIRMLKDRNPGFDGTLQHRMEDGSVVELHIEGQPVTDLSPLRVLPKLRFLTCTKCPLSDLSPIRELPLEFFHGEWTLVVDLSPLRTMPLKSLRMAFAHELTDLKPLQGMKLETLGIQSTRVSDLTPLQGMPLKSLDMAWTSGVTDLKPLRGMPLDYLNLSKLPISDLSELSGMTTLRFLILQEMPISDLSALQGLQLERLYLRGSAKVSDLHPIREMPLWDLTIHGTGVTDLSPLKGMQLKMFRLTPGNITHGLEIIRGMTSLETIGTGETESQPAAEFWKNFETP